MSNGVADGAEMVNSVQDLGPLVHSPGVTLSIFFAIFAIFVKDLHSNFLLFYLCQHPKRNHDCVLGVVLEVRTVLRNYA